MNLRRIAELCVVTIISAGLPVAAAMLPASLAPKAHATTAPSECPPAVDPNQCFDHFGTAVVSRKVPTSDGDEQVFYVTVDDPVGVYMTPQVIAPLTGVTAVLHWVMRGPDGRVIFDEEPPQDGGHTSATPYFLPHGQSTLTISSAESAPRTRFLLTGSR